MLCCYTHLRRASRSFAFQQQFNLTNRIMIIRQSRHKHRPLHISVHHRIDSCRARHVLFHSYFTKKENIQHVQALNLARGQRRQAQHLVSSIHKALIFCVSHARGRDSGRESQTYVEKRRKFNLIGGRNITQNLRRRTSSRSRIAAALESSLGKAC